MSVPGHAPPTLRPELDLTAPERRGDDDARHRTLALLRQEMPVAWHAHPSGGFWAVTRHADVSRALREWQTYGQADGHRLDALEAREAGALAALEAPAYRDDASPFSRARVRSRFARDAVEALAPGVRARLVERLVSHAGAVDFVALVDPLPREVRATLAGVPGAHQDRVIAWITTLEAAAAEPGGAGGEAQRHAAGALAEYGDELLAHKREHPSEDIASDWLAGAPVTGRSMALMLYALIGVGSATTRRVAAAGQRLLLEAPDVARRLRHDPSLVPSAVEEMLRLAPPLHCVRRTARVDTRLGDQEIAKGDSLTLWLSSANRDPEVFAEPARARLDRDPNPHQTCAAGGLFTLGAELARLELRILFEEVLARFPEIVPAGACERAPSHVENRIARLPVHLGRPA